MPVKDVSADGESQLLIPEIIEKLGFGWAQVRAGVIGGGVYFADGAELLLISAVTSAVAEQWAMSPVEKSLVVMVVFVGILLGNFVSGPVADTYGRRQLILASFLGIVIFSILSSLAVNFITLSLWRFFVGAAFGLGQPAWNTLGAEITPADWRVAMQGISQGCFVLGELFSCMLLLLDDPHMERLHWRRLLQLGAIPAGIFLILALLFLHQSPSFLAVAGRREEATAVLESMCHDNHVEVSCDYRVATRPNQLPPRMRRNSRRVSVQSSADLRRQLFIVFGPDLRTSTFIVMYSCFVLNFLYYGCLYAFPQVLAESSTGSGGAALELLIGAIWEIPGQALGIVCGLLLRRKLNMQLYLFLVGISTLAFVLGNTRNTHASHIVETIGYYGIKCFVDIGFVVVYQYSIEIYPTKVRATGSAITVGSGRIGGILSPLVYELIASEGSYAVFFYVLVVLCAVNFLMIPLLKYETQGVPLKDELEEEAPEAPSQGGPQAAQQQSTEEASPLLEREAALVPEPFVPR
mmetsp:Transcript_27958/g.65207  ORF Transcript_27958/g.65207 Transcript_27958/m.65207 type:complete len:522 (+) Transcript_27958:126-1691(+)